MDNHGLKRLGYQVLLTGLVGLYIFIAMLPLSGHAARFPGPELIPALLFAWVLRRPDYVPVLLAALLLFTADLLFQRPPGLHAGLTLIGLEFLRARAGTGPEMPFALEWFTLGLVLGAILLAERLILGVFFVGEVSYGRAILQFMATVAAYPVVVLVSAMVFGVRRALPGEAEGLRVKTS